jgi:two-component system, OmpR family, response regulator RegX3
VKCVVLTTKERRPVPSPTVFIIADNADSAGIWIDALRRRGIESIHLRYGVQPQDIALPKHFDLVLIDSHETGDIPLEICGIVRAACDKPILLLTPENDERYQLKAYEVGVDECMVAPVSVLVFLAKIRVWLQRVARAESLGEEINESGFHLDPKTRQVFMPDGRAVNLSVQEFQLLRLFLTNPGRVLDTDFLMSRIWNHDTYDNRTILTNLVYRLRQKIDPRSSPGMHIQRIPGEGYRWKSSEPETIVHP